MNSKKPCRSSNISWVAAKELTSSHFIGEITLLTIYIYICMYTHYGSLNLSSSKETQFTPDPGPKVFCEQSRFDRGGVAGIRLINQRAFGIVILTLKSRIRCSSYDNYEVLAFGVGDTEFLLLLIGLVHKPRNQVPIVGNPTISAIHL